MNTNTHTRYRAWWNLAFLVLAGYPLSGGAAPGTLSDEPLFATTSAEPNIFFMIDDSGSMDGSLMTSEQDGTYGRCRYVFDNPGDNIYVNMVECGEASGTIDGVIERLAALGEQQQNLRMRIGSAIRYPIIVICSLFTGFTILVTMVIPRFARIYSELSGNLPLPTKIASRLLCPGSIEFSGQSSKPQALYPLRI